MPQFTELHSEAHSERGYVLSMENCNLLMQKILSRTIGGCVFRELQFPFTLKTSYLDFKKKVGALSLVHEKLAPVHSQLLQCRS